MEGRSRHGCRFVGLWVDQDIAELQEWPCTNDLNIEAAMHGSTGPFKLRRRRSEPFKESGMKHTRRGFDVEVVAIRIA